MSHNGWHLKRMELYDVTLYDEIHMVGSIQFHQFTRSHSVQSYTPHTNHNNNINKQAWRV